MEDDDAGHFCVSRQWMHKFDTFADPGQVDNSDFLCRHGGMLCDRPRHHWGDCIARSLVCKEGMEMLANMVDYRKLTYPVQCHGHSRVDVDLSSV